MNKREHANTLSDKDFVAWGRKFFGTDWDSASVVMSNDEIAEASVKILNQPHETTGHEDLIADGWMLGSVDEDEMEYVTNNQESLMGKIVEIKCSGLSQDSNGNYSTLHPVFKMIRTDKDTANTLQECIEINDSVSLL